MGTGNNLSIPPIPYIGNQQSQPGGAPQQSPPLPTELDEDKHLFDQFGTPSFIPSTKNPVNNPYAPINTN